MLDYPIEAAYDRDENFAAKYFRVDVETVRGWRKRKKGPPYAKIGGKSVRYSLADLQSWAATQRVETSA